MPPEKLPTLLFAESLTSEKTNTKEQTKKLVKFTQQKLTKLSQFKMLATVLIHLREAKQTKKIWQTH